MLIATLEYAIGLGLISGKLMRLTLLLLAFQMVGAASPLLLFHVEVSTAFPFAPTLEGQYIIKNVVLVIGATVRGGLPANPQGIEDSAGQIEGRERREPGAKSVPTKRSRVRGLTRWSSEYVFGKTDPRFGADSIIQDSV